MGYLLGAYSGPLALAFLLHLAVLAALYGAWLPQQLTPITIKPQIVNAKLILVQPKVLPRRPPPAPKPAAAQAPAKPPAQRPAVAPKPKPEPKVDRAEEQRQRQLAEQQRRLAELARQSFDQVLESEAAQLHADEGMVAVQSFRFGIYQRVVANWSRPPSARNGMEARLTVELIPTGDVVSVTVVESSGNSAFDRSAEAAVRVARTFDVPLRSNLFERHFRRFSLLFKPEDLLR